jgi:hypothetical protein
MFPKILFGGTPPRVDFAIFKQTTGVNIIDVPAGQMHALGEEGQLAGVVSEIGNTLRRTLEATLNTMQPGQSIRVQILIHGTAGFEFAGSSFGTGVSFQDQASFVFGNVDNVKSTVVPIKTKMPQNNLNENKKIIILSGDQFVDDGSKIIHPPTGNDGSSDIIDLH